MSQYAISYKSNNDVVYSCKYHVVWCPKYRRSVLINGVDARLREMLQDICTASRAEILALDIMPDHVHLLVEVDPQSGIHRLVRALKGRSSRLLRHEFSWLKSRLPTLWTNSYFVSTVGGAPDDMMQQYIAAQPRSERGQRNASATNRATTSFTLVGTFADFTLSVLIRRG